jgi:glycosyltransferase involved in cell wall biosynthesis
MKILLVGHACGPGLGSEPGKTWEFAWGLSADHEVWLITHPEHRAKVEETLARTQRAGLHVIFVNVKSRFDPWTPGKGESGIRLHYVLWLKAAYREARRLHKRIQFDVVHHVSWATVAAAPSFWKLQAPVVWGPVGGGQTAPDAFLPYFGPGARRESMRSRYTRLRTYFPGLRRSARAAGITLVTNRETAALLRAAGAKDIRLFLDCGLTEEPQENTHTVSGEGEPCIFLWAGRLEPHKGLPLALEALSRVRNLRVKLLIAGQGAYREAYEEQARKLGIANMVQFLGAIPHEEMPALFRYADAFLFTSLRDTFGTVVLEAMSHALPVITLDHQGVGSFVPETAGIKIPVTTPSEVIGGLARAIETTARCGSCRLKMGTAALECAKAETWTRRVSRLTAMYEEVISAHRGV